MAEYRMASQFSKDGKYFAQLTTDGKLKIWETATSTFKQEFTPDLHLTTPCTCLHWVQGTTQSQCKKKKRRSSTSSMSTDTSTPLLAMGTSSGILLLYSVATAQVETTINSNTSKSISCISWESAQDVYAGAQEFILQFNLKDRSVNTKWKSGTEKICSILHVPDKDRLLTASKTIKFWSISTREIIKTFTGHSSNVTLLKFIPSDYSSESYFFSGSVNDRLLNCWSLNENATEKSAVASLIMEDVPVSANLMEGSDNTTILAAVTRNGVAHLYQHKLNGKHGKPIKPKLTIQVATDTGQKQLVAPIPIVAAYIYSDTEIMIAHGNYLILTFENVFPNYSEKVQCLIRKEPCETLNSKKNEVKKSREAVVSGSVDYLTPHTANNVRQKRKSDDRKKELPMELRMEDLTLNKSNAGVPKQDNVAQLLVQGLHSKDKLLLHQALSKKDEATVRNTVKRLPMQVIVPLVTELATLIHGKTLSSQTAVIWLKEIIQCHASQLTSNPDLEDLILPILSVIENRLTLFAPLSRLSGRVNLLVSQISESSNKSSEAKIEALLVYKDEGSEESDAEDNLELNLHSSSENEWVEEDSGNDSNAEEEEDDDVKIAENNVSDSEMSL